jgi:predicted ATPase
MRPELPTGTVTFLFTDVEGSTRLLHELGAEGYAAALAEHRRLIRKACSRNDGVEVDTQGDAFFFAFPTAPGALAAAGEMTEALASGPIQVRIGLHTGTPLLTEEGYVGGDVHRAARIAAAGHGGQVLVSSSTAQLVELELTDLGEHRLKDIDGAVSIFQLGGGSFPPLKTISNTNLPRPASSFVGRERELSEVLSRIEGGARLVTLTGPGGSGKTRLALEAAASLVSEYKAGVFWIGLASLRDPALVTETISQTLGAKDGLAEHIAEREMLLLLDNLEQVIEAAAELSSVLSACPNLTLLVTSRELLRIQGEVEYPVPPLAEPEAVSLFCERAQLEPSDDISELCARLDNLPLAVELAAARTKALSPAQILERLSSRLDLLKGGRDADPRQQTLRATIEWSYDLLSPEEQQLFASLSVFAGGCTLEAAEEVAGADLDTLQSLVEKSLLRFTNERYWMLETIREYAWERLEEAGDGAQMRSLHLEFFAGLARDGSVPGALIRGGPEREWTDRLDEERDNFRGAMSWSVAGAHTQRAHEVAIAYGLLCATRGPLSEGRSWLEAALLETKGVAPALRQRALHGASNLAERQGDLETARVHAQESLDLARTIDDPYAIGSALLSLGVIESDANHNDLAEALQREALTVFEASGNEREVRLTLGLLGFLYLSGGHYSAAKNVCEQALTMSRSAGDERGILVAASNLGHALSQEGRLEEALHLQREALVIARKLVDLQAFAEILLDVASLAIALQKHRTAARLLGGIQELAESAEFALVPVEVQWFGEMIAIVRHELGAEDVVVEMDEGHRMSPEDIAAHAIEFIDSAA